MKKTLLILLFSILISANALACNFKISNFGDKKEQIKLDVEAAKNYFGQALNQLPR